MAFLGPSVSNQSRLGETTDDRPGQSGRAHEYELGHSDRELKRLRLRPDSSIRLPSSSFAMPGSAAECESWISAAEGVTPRCWRRSWSATAAKSSASTGPRRHRGRTWTDERARKAQLMIPAGRSCIAIEPLRGNLTRSWADTAHVQSGSRGDAEIARLRTLCGRSRPSSYFMRPIGTGSVQTLPFRLTISATTGLFGRSRRSARTLIWA